MDWVKNLELHSRRIWHECSQCFEDICRHILFITRYDKRIGQREKLCLALSIKKIADIEYKKNCVENLFWIAAIEKGLEVGNDNTNCRNYTSLSCARALKHQLLKLWWHLCLNHMTASYAALIMRSHSFRSIYVELRISHFMYPRTPVNTSLKLYNWWNFD